MEIIKITNKDYLEEIFTLFIQNIEYHSEFDKERYTLTSKELEETKKDLENMILNKNNIIFALKLNYNILGFISGIIQEDFLIIRDLIVDENYRDNGNGKKLINTVLQYAKENNVKEVFVSVHCKNQNAIDFYHLFNFKDFSIKMSLKL